MANAWEERTPECRSVTLVLTDNEEGGVDLHASFDREVELADQEAMSNCEITALKMLMHAFPPGEQGVEWTPETTKDESDAPAN